VLFIFHDPHIAIFISIFTLKLRIIKLRNASFHISKIFKTYYANRVVLSISFDIGVNGPDGFFNEIFEILPRRTRRKAFDNDTEGGVTGTEFTAVAISTVTTTAVVATVTIVSASSSVIPAIAITTPVAPVTVITPALGKFYAKSAAVEIVVVAATDCVTSIPVEN
jgi:hypothetical protein